MVEMDEWSGVPTPYLTDNSLAFLGIVDLSPGRKGLQCAQGGHHPSGEFSLRGSGSGEENIP